ncbi:hypothetical protein AVEN_37123-1 [Araneus ventricosus]|uniref:Uncharacterized protein n=1 Tax=Araneus ventricosus TaxID=182803 RepID=A0A4Y2FW71_ARAVE|nr:hypothetical protein AVEN_37123-1 [Araneus ventricosus]
MVLFASVLLFKASHLKFRQRMENMQGWTFTTAPRQNRSSMRKTDENWSSVERKVGYPVLHLDCRATNAEMQQVIISLKDIPSTHTQISDGFLQILGHDIDVHTYSHFTVDHQNFTNTFRGKQSHTITFPP